jgi:FkbM family methyltransferase
MERMHSAGIRAANILLRAVPWRLRGVVKNIPVVAKLQRELLSRVMGTDAFVYRVDCGPARGVNFLLHWPDDKNLWTGTYETQFASCLEKMIVSGTVAYDIGGWHGFYTGVMAARGAKEVHVFEPLPQNLERIEHLRSLNPAFQIIVHDYALGDRDGFTELVVMPKTGMAKLAESEFQAEFSSPNRIQVRIAKIDTLVLTGAIPPPALIKMDVEGAEVLILNGARHVLTRYQPILFAELHSPSLLAQCESIITNVGYEMFDLKGRQLSTTTKAISEVTQIVALPPPVHK